MADTIKGKVEEAGHSAAEATKNAGEKVSEGAESTADWVKDKAHDAGEKTAEAAEATGDKMKEAGQALKDKSGA